MNNKNGQSVGSSLNTGSPVGSPPPQQQSQISRRLASLESFFQEEQDAENNDKQQAQGDSPHAVPEGSQTSSTTSTQQGRKKSPLKPKPQPPTTAASSSSVVSSDTSVGGTPFFEPRSPRPPTSSRRVAPTSTATQSSVASANTTTPQTPQPSAMTSPRASTTAGFLLSSPPPPPPPPPRSVSHSDVTVSMVSSTTTVSSSAAATSSSQPGAVQAVRRTQPQPDQQPPRTTANSRALPPLTQQPGLDVDLETLLSKTTLFSTAPTGQGGTRSNINNNKKPLFPDPLSMTQQNREEKQTRRLPLPPTRRTMSPPPLASSATGSTQQPQQASSTMPLTRVVANTQRGRRPSASTGSTLANVLGAGPSQSRGEGRQPPSSTQTTEVTRRLLRRTTAVEAAPRETNRVARGVRRAMAIGPDGLVHHRFGSFTIPLAATAAVYSAYHIVLQFQGLNLFISIPDISSSSLTNAELMRYSHFLQLFGTGVVNNIGIGALTIGTGLNLLSLITTMVHNGYFRIPGRYAQTWRDFVQVAIVGSGFGLLMNYGINIMRTTESIVNNPAAFVQQALHAPQNITFNGQSYQDCQDFQVNGLFMPAAEAAVACLLAHLNTEVFEEIAAYILSAASGAPFVLFSSIILYLLVVRMVSRCDTSDEHSADTAGGNRPRTGRATTLRLMEIEPGREEEQNDDDEEAAAGENRPVMRAGEGRSYGTEPRESGTNLLVSRHFLNRSRGALPQTTSDEPREPAERRQRCRCALL